jgi:hypothetical protein
MKIALKDTLSGLGLPRMPGCRPSIPRLMPIAPELSPFRRGYHGALGWMPCLHDRYEEGGTTKSEYFWQDLQVAR